MSEYNEATPDSNCWKIITDNDPNSISKRRIVNTIHDQPIPKEAYNHAIYTPVVLAPISKSSTLVLSAYLEDGELGLRLHDLRLVDKQIVGSITFTLRGNSFQLGKFKNEMNRVADGDRCVGISFLLRKLFYAGFRTIYADKKLRPRESASLQTAVNIIKMSAENEMDDFFNKIKNEGHNDDSKR